MVRRIDTVAWTFTSARTTGAEPLPLSVLRFTPVVDAHNRVVGGGHYRVGFSTAAQPGAAPVTEVTIEVSHDGGASWVRPSVSGAGGSGVAVVARPAGFGTVSIRSTATDRDGGTVEQTVTDAFRY